MYRSSVHLSHQSTAATAAGELYRQAISWTAAGAVQQAPTLGSKCGWLHVDSQCRRLNTDLFLKV